MIFLKNCTISRRISIATILAVAIGVSILVWRSATHIESEIASITENNYLAMTKLITKQASGAIRWNKNELVKQAYAQVAEAKNSTLANFAAFNSENKLIQKYNSTELPNTDLQSLFNKYRHQLKPDQTIIEKTDKHHLIIIPIYHVRSGKYLGATASAWSLHKSNLRVHQANIENISTGLVIIIAMSIVLYFMLKMFIITPLRNMIDLTKELANQEADLSKRLKVDSSDELNELAHWINIFLAKVQDLFGKVKQSSDQLNVSANSMATLANKNKTVVGDQQNDIIQVTSAMSQINSSVAEISQKASEASDASNQAFTLVDNSSDVIDQSITSVNALSDDIASTADVVENLAKDTDKIGGVLDVIRGIAEQTNLLALNAAIEAARAGEQGRGFAVVADEVRTLAGLTQKSTQEIQDMIEDLQSGSSNAVAAMQKSQAQALEAVNLSKDVNGFLQQVTQIITTINDMNSHIAENAEEQNNVTNTVNQNINNVNQLFEQIVNIAADNLNTGESLLKLSDLMAKSLNKFKS